MSWVKLEEFVCDILKDDLAMRTPGSGNSKKEEDVISLNTITQCKYTDKESISVKKKDITRLLSAANLLKKQPLMCIQVQEIKLLCIPVTNEFITKIES